MELDEFHVANASPVPKSPHSGRNISQKGHGGGGGLRKRNLGLWESWGLVSGGLFFLFPPTEGSE